MTELFPMLSITMQQCIEEKLTEEPDFKLTDFRDETVKDIIERLKAKRNVNSKEISYLKGMVKRATVDHQEQPR